MRPLANGIIDQRQLVACDLGSEAFRHCTTVHKSLQVCAKGVPATCSECITDPVCWETTGNIGVVLLNNRCCNAGVIRLWWGNHALALSTTDSSLPKEKDLDSKKHVWR